MKLLATVFWRGTVRVRRSLLLLVPILLGLSTLWVIEPLYARYAIDTMLTATSGAQVDFAWIFGWWGALFIAVNLTNASKYYVQWHILNNVLAEVRERYYEHLLELDIAHHIKSRGGELMKKIDDAADSVVDLISEIVMDLIPSMITAVAFYILSFMISWQLALLALLFLPVYGSFVWLSVWYTRTNIDKVNRLWVEALGRGYDSLGNIFTVKSSAAEDRELEHMHSIHERGIRELKQANAVWALLEGLNFFMLMRVVLIAAGVALLIKGQLTLGSLFFFQFSFFRLITPIEMISRLMPRWNEKISKIKLAEDTYRKAVIVQNAEHPVIPTTLNGEIVFDHVSFAYGATDAIADLVLTVKPGEHIALVGHSGAGKSTIAMLLNRFYDVTSGQILIDGTNIRTLDLHWWRSQIGLVLQENIMFNDTIMNNIRYARPEATDEEVKEAAKRASAEEFIMNLQAGYATMIGERGIRLSGGERQRIAIARAILKQPKIVVLDEATSALDSITEQGVQRGIASLIKDKTSFIIAHRLSTVKAVHRIAVLEKGRLIACAPHHELLTTCEVYRRMVELQSGGLLAEHSNNAA